MSDFSKSYTRTMKNEGAYSANPRDPGGETYMGISRIKWASWPGWREIDNVKSEMIKIPNYGTSSYDVWVHHLNSLLAVQPKLQLLIQGFYREYFWKAIGDITDQRIADEVFDKCVNCGNVAAFWLQRAAGVGADGIIGSLTISTVNSLDPVTLLHDFNELAKAHYDGIISHDPTQAVFRKSWYSRLKNYDDTPFVA